MQDDLKNYDFPEYVTPRGCKEWWCVRDALLDKIRMLDSILEEIKKLQNQMQQKKKKEEEYGSVGLAKPLRLPLNIEQIYWLYYREDGAVIGTKDGKSDHGITNR